MTLNQNTPLQILKKYYGYDTFRLQQAEIIDTIISGRDCLVLIYRGSYSSIPCLPGSNRRLGEIIGDLEPYKIHQEITQEGLVPS